MVNDIRGYLTTTADTAKTIKNVTWTYEPITRVNLGNIEYQQLIEEYARNPNNYKAPKYNNKIEGVEIMKLYEVWMVYAENRSKPKCTHIDGVIAKDPEDAKIKSGLMKDIPEEWDADYHTFIVKEIGDVKVKEKPKEVKNI